MNSALPEILRITQDPSTEPVARDAREIASVVEGESEFLTRQSARESLRRWQRNDVDERVRRHARNFRIFRAYF